VARITYSRPSAHGLPPGVEVRPLEAHADGRGRFVEVFREVWRVPVERPVQWNLLESQAGALRGVRLHPLHDDCQVFFVGSACLGLADLRFESPARGLGLTIEVDEPALVTIPSGVAHGVYYRERAFQAVGVSRYYDAEDELRVRWDDPKLAIPWPAIRPALSPEDENAGSYAELVAAYEAVVRAPAHRGAR
jgi:dTDP-4-dehydrorhamnose 3,5-epimerase